MDKGQTQLGGGRVSPEMHGTIHASGAGFAASPLGKPAPQAH
jgi:hypothetical protein